MVGLLLCFPAVLIVGYLVIVLFGSSVTRIWLNVKEPALKEARWHWHAFLQSDNVAAIISDSRCSREDVRLTFESLVATGTQPSNALALMVRNKQLLQ